MTKVDRTSRCIVAWAVDMERAPNLMQEVADGGPAAERTAHDGYNTYESLVYPGEDILSPGKAEVYGVESVNADLRHYLARLARCSRCFSRSLAAVRTALKLFVYYFNQRCLERLAYPTYAFTYPLVP